MRRIYGIDLGTTNSCISCIDDDGVPIIIPNARGEVTTPSVVFFESKGNVIVGQAAKDVISIYPDKCVAMVKWFMGDPHWKREFFGQVYTPQDISSFILRKVVADAEKVIGEKIENVVITCPAYFGVIEREATKQAGFLAGLNVLNLISEPTAAVLAYGVEQDQDQVVLVYDLGGGNFGITVIEIKNREANIISAGGDHQLGGKDWDDAVVTYFVQRFEEATGTSADALLEDQETYQELIASAERCKKTLSSRHSVTEAIRFGGERVKVELTRETFDYITAQYLERTLILTDQEIESARRRGCKHIDKLLLVGGSTYMPQVIDSVKSRFSFDIVRPSFNQMIARGAAIFGYDLYSGEQIERGEYVDVSNVDRLGLERSPVIEQAQKEVTQNYGLSLPNLKTIAYKKISQVTSRSFGIVARNREGKEVVRNLILREDPVPILRSTLLEGSEKKYSQIQLRLMENEEKTSEVELEQCREVGMAVIFFQRPVDKSSKVEVILSLSPDGLMTITGQDLSTGRELKTSFRTDAVKAIQSDERPVAFRNQVFISYSHKDRLWLDQLMTMLSPVLRSGAFSIWEDSRIDPGTRWQEEIENALAVAKVAVLLVSKEFLASGFIAENELPVLLSAARTEGLTIVWILLKPCLYEETEIYRFQAAHDLTKPLAKLRGADREAVLTDICKIIKKAMQAPDLSLAR